MTLALLFALLAMIAVWSVFDAVRSPRLVEDLETGEMTAEPTDLEQLLGPIARRLLGSRRGGSVSLERQLAWARIDVSAELWSILPVILAIGGAMAGVSFALYNGISSEVVPGIALGGAILFAVYPSSVLSRKLRARAEQIELDAPSFIAQFARTFDIYNEEAATITAICADIREERRRWERRWEMPDMARRRLERSATQRYGSDVWNALLVLESEMSGGLYAAGATEEKPDPLLRFGIACGNDDIREFAINLREAQRSGHRITAESLKAKVASIRKSQAAAAKREEGAAVLRSTVFLVMFNLPILLFSLLGPIMATLNTALPS